MDFRYPPQPSLSSAAATIPAMTNSNLLHMLQRTGSIMLDGNKTSMPTGDTHQADADKGGEP